MAQIKVNLGIRSYVIEIGKENLLKIDFSKYGISRYGIITDSNVRSLYGEDLQDNNFFELATNTKSLYIPNPNHLKW
ncbi:MAG: hypothetical protein KAU20_06255 [Nanoarchaeota archaeon]|nr:hypothetical protein [Nanoarchaeota archaeon]